jgi:two-component system, OmpR family, alkaline phosphatase synthesis response regulator PhoP
MHLLVLIAEDDTLTRRGLVDVLSGEGFACLQAADGHAACELYEQHHPNFVCLDVMMPGLNGYEVCRRIRAIDPQVPIIFLTAKSEEVDKVVGLELGGDDYIVKPFGVKEVLARIRAVARRCLAAQTGPGHDHVGQPFRMGELEIHPRQLRARRGDAWIDLSLREIKILQLLFEQAGQVVDRNSLMNYAWGQDYLPSSRTLDQHVSQLRKRIELDPKRPAIIQTVHGVGYRWEAGGDSHCD